MVFDKCFHQGGIPHHQKRQTLRGGSLTKASFVLMLCSLFLLPSCAGFFHAGDPFIGKKGVTSWYGKKFHGRRTANGEVYNMYGMTAAHRSLPFGTYLKVTDLSSGKSVRVRINDRGPFVRGRFLDLSFGAAKALGIVERGIATVRIKIIDPGGGKASGEAFKQRYTIQVASFKSKDKAIQLKNRLSKWYKPVRILPIESHEGVYFRVRVGIFDNSREAHRLAKRLKRVEGLTPFVTVRRT